MWVRVVRLSVFALHVHAYILQLHCFGLQLGSYEVQFADYNLYWFSLTLGDVNVPGLKVNGLKIAYYNVLTFIPPCH